MHSEDEYRRQAAEAQKEADRAIHDDDRASWLRVAQGWLSLIRKRPQSDEEAFEARTKTEGTGQPASDASN
jgi:hypothetical protein